MSFTWRSRTIYFGIISCVWKKPSLILVYICCVFCLGLARIDNRESRNVLVIHSYHPESSWAKQEKTGIDSGFQEARREVNVFHEFLDSKRYPDLQHGRDLLDYIDKKYRFTDIDLLMVADDPSLQLILQRHQENFTNLPVVFLGVNHVNPKLAKIPWLTGVYENHGVAATIAEATRQTQQNKIIVITDSTATGRAYEAQVKQIGKTLDTAIDIQIVRDLVPEEIETHLGKYAANIPILVLGQLRKGDSNGALIDHEEDAPIINSYISNPIYTVSSMRLGTGVVGGKILDGSYHARQAVELADLILDGVPPHKIEPIVEAKNRWIFDYPQLKRFNIDINQLPEQSELIDIAPSFYEANKVIVWIVVSVLLIGLLIIALLIEIIRRRSLAESILRENKQRYQDLAEAGANVFWELDKNLKYCYVSGEDMGIEHLEPHTIIGKSPQDVYCHNSQVEFNWLEFERIINRHTPLEKFTFTVRDCQENIRIFELNGNPIFDRHQQYRGYRGIQREITAEYNLSQKIAYQASYDSLTGLINRHRFDEKLREAVKQVQTYGGEKVLCYLDLDRFKIVNDTAGHLVGDRLLAELAQIFSNMIRKGDTLGRLGGDEFGLILEDCQIQQAKPIGEDIIAALEAYRFRWRTLEFDVGVSIGMVPITNNTVDATELLSRADLACYQAKNSGRGRVYIADGNDAELNLEQTQMAHIANVSQTIAENRFHLVKQLIQPIIASNGSYRHYEILLRLRDRNGNSISPTQFIPVAERYGVITVIDRWVLETTLAHYAKCFASGRTMVSINLSGVSINDERFTALAIELIESSSVPRDCLCFEITETAAISQIDRAIEFIEQMKELGVKFALDDFGSGVSSFAYLKSLPVDYLKIDGSLIQNLANRHYDREIVRAIERIAHLMEIKTIAECVENDDILRLLGKIGVDYAQGYRIGQPTLIQAIPVPTKVNF